MKDIQLENIQLSYFIVQSKPFILILEDITRAKIYHFYTLLLKQQDIGLLISKFILPYI